MKKHIFLLLCLVATVSFPFSIWASSENEEFKSLLTVKRASKVGDIVTIVIRENARMSSERDSLELQKILMGIVGGVVEATTNVSLRNFIPINNNPAQKRESEIRSVAVAEISAVVVDIDKYGNLVIEGKKRIKVDKNLQEIIIKGKVRPEDVQLGNKVDSSKVADAEIWVNGRLVFSSEPGKESWFDKVLAFLASLFT